ncbi:Roundabout -like protein 3 [Collichthys lucidus]|uniref:Roundabout-like protein 3 n=1 Tax=Collichthys lucidus TaxID=240159 RepID=A0A4V6ARA8_COLLU|nr:Roundabout -like protein 3 [Collichthys lucidus]
MLRYLLKTLLQMNLFTDTIRTPSNGTDLFFNISLPSFNSSLLDWGNFTGFNVWGFSGGGWSNRGYPGEKLNSKAVGGQPVWVDLELTGRLNGKINAAR